MKNFTITAVSILITSLLFFLMTHFVVVKINTDRCLFVGETKGYAKIEAIIKDSDFTKSDLRMYLSSDEYQRNPSKPEHYAILSFIFTSVLVTIYSLIKLTLNKLLKNTPNHRFHSIADSARSE
jgi:hypothetical protein